MPNMIWLIVLPDEGLFWTRNNGWNSFHKGPEVYTSLKEALDAIDSLREGVEDDSWRPEPVGYVRFP